MYRQWRREHLPTLRTAGRIPPGGWKPHRLHAAPPAAPLPTGRSRGQHWNRRRATVAPRFSPRAVALAVTETLGEQTCNQQSSRETPGSHAEGREKTRGLPISLATMTTGYVAYDETFQGVRTPACTAYRITDWPNTRLEREEGGGWVTCRTKPRHNMALRP